MINYTHIYTLQSDSNDIVRYVGKTDYPKKRLKLHTYNAGRKNMHLKRWMDKCGDVTLDVIDIVPKAEWPFWEKWYINLFRSWGFKLINLTEGGDGAEGYKHSEETRELMRKNHADFKGANHPQYGKPGNMTGKKHKPETLQKMSVWQLGEKNHRFGTKCVHSKETIEKCSISKKEAWVNGVYGGEEYREKIRQAKLGKPLVAVRKPIKCNETGEMFNSIKEASLKITGGCNGNGNIVSQLKGKLKTAYGYTFSYI